MREGTPKAGESENEGHEKDYAEKKRQHWEDSYVQAED